MSYNLVKNTIELLEEFEKNNTKNSFENNIEGFKKWIAYNYVDKNHNSENVWEGSEHGRSAESVISTLLVHMGRFGKLYSKAAISGSEFSTQEDFIYLITLKAFGKMSKMDLIKKNVHEKPSGMLIINRLISKNWLQQEDVSHDKRTKYIAITEKGLEALENQMDSIRTATKMVSGNLTYKEKLELIRILTKLEDFHSNIYDKNLDVDKILSEYESIAHLYQ